MCSARAQGRGRLLPVAVCICPGQRPGFDDKHGDGALNPFLRHFPKNFSALLYPMAERDQLEYPSLEWLKMLFQHKWTESVVSKLDETATLHPSNTNRRRLLQAIECLTKMSEPQFMVHSFYVTNLRN